MTGWVAAAAATAVLVSTAVHAHLIRPFLPVGVAGTEPFVGPTDPTARLRGWERLVRALERQGLEVCPGWYGAAAELRFHGYGGRIAAGCEANGRRAPRPRGERVLWIEPSAGATLPGGFEVRVPATCEVLPVRAAGWDHDLVRPLAPVRVRLLSCPPFANRPPVW